MGHNAQLTEIFLHFCASASWICVVVSSAWQQQNADIQMTSVHKVDESQIIAADLAEHYYTISYKFTLITTSILLTFSLRPLLAFSSVV